MIENYQAILTAYSQYISPDGKINFFQIIQPSDYVEVLTLRNLAYSKANKIAKMATVQHLSDRFDCASIIIGVRQEQRLIGSIRVTELAESYPNFLYPYYQDMPDCPDIDDTAEGSRLCILPSAKGQGLALILEVLMVLTAYYRGKKYLLGSAEGTLINFHTRCGFKRLGKTYVNDTFNDIPHELLIMDIAAVLKGQGVESKIWNEIYLPAIKIFNSVKEVEFL